MTERERLIEELQILVRGNEETVSAYELITEFILADRKRICEPLVKLRNGTYGNRHWDVMASEAIDKTLNRAFPKEGK